MAFELDGEDLGVWLWCTDCKTQEMIEDTSLDGINELAAKHEREKHGTVPVHN